MHYWLNFILMQLVWFAAVGGAGHGLAWAGPLGFAVFAAVHFAFAPRIAGEWRLMGVAIVLGGATDSLMAATGLATYASPVPSAQLAPLWIIALWAGFALTLNHSLTWMTRRPLLAAVFGGIVGPLSYLGAARLFNAVTFAEPVMTSLVVLGACWFVAMFVLCHLAVLWRGPAKVTAVPAPLMRAP